MNAQEKIQQLQLFEQSMQSLLQQKQTMQVQLAEIESALKELQGKESAYKIIGNIMVATPSSELQTDLQSKKELVELRITTLDKQENDVKEKAEALQKEVVEDMKNERSQ